MHRYIRSRHPWMLVLLVMFVLTGVLFGSQQRALAQLGTAGLTFIREATPESDIESGIFLSIPNLVIPRGAFGTSGSGVLTNPQGIAVAKDGSVYVANTLDHSIKHFDAAGNFIRKWGGSGTGDGKFFEPTGMAVGPDGSVYVADTGNHRIQQFNPVGTFVRMWGTDGGDEGKFVNPTGVAVGPDGSVYVADTGNHRIQQFDAVGTFIRMWGKDVIEDNAKLGFEVCTSNCRSGSVGGLLGEFSQPGGVAVGPDGMVYVADTANHRIQQFDAQGFFFAMWGRDVIFGNVGTGFELCTSNCKIGVVGGGAGEFDEPRGIAVALDASLYVADRSNHRVQQFDRSLAFVRMWGKDVDQAGGVGFEVCASNCKVGEESSDLGALSDPTGVAVGPNGTLYVVEIDGSRGQLFWGAPIILDDPVVDDGDAYSNTVELTALPAGDYLFNEAHSPTWVLEDVTCVNGSVSHTPNSDDFIITLVAGQHTICTLHTRERVSLTLIKEAVPADGTDFTIIPTLIPLESFSGSWNQLIFPSNIATAKDGMIYVTDSSVVPLQQFDAATNLLHEWGIRGLGVGQINSPSGIAVGAGGSIYVSDNFGHRIVQYDNKRNFIREWGVFGSGAGQFNGPTGVAIGLDGSVNVVDTGNHRIQQFDPAGTFIRQWGTVGNGAGQFSFPSDIAVGPDGSVLVADTLNNRIQQFDAVGNFVRMWGEGGSDEGEFGNPTGVAVGPDGSVYVADRNNERVQQFDALGNFVRLWGKDVVAGNGETGYEVCTSNCKSGEKGSNIGEFNVPVDVAVSADGSLYVADRINLRVQRFLGAAIKLDNSAVDDGDDYKDTVQIKELSAGVYEFTEVGIAPWTLNDVDCDGGALSLFPGFNKFHIQLAANEEIVCTLKNDAPRLTVNVVVVGGGPLGVDSFPVSVGDKLMTLGVATAFDAGQHTVLPTSNGQYTQVIGGNCNSSGVVTLSVGFDAVCTITYTFIPQSLTVNVVVVGGGPLSAANFPIFVNGNAVTSGAATQLLSGQQTVSQTGNPQYTTVFSGACNSSGVVTLPVGGNLVCTVTNTFIPQSLTVNVEVVGGGPLSTANFPVFVNGNAVTRGVATPLLAGQHTVSQTGNPQYATVFSGACNSSGVVTLPIGGNLVCTITNTFIAQTLTVNVEVVGGGPLSADGFPIFVNGNAVTRGAATPLLAGQHTVSQTGNPQYTTVFGGACNSGGVVTLPIGGNLVCTITNTFLTGVLSGSIWQDANGNGLREEGEAGSPGVTVVLGSPPDLISAQAVVATTTDANGQYQFTGLASGEYQVRVVPPVGMEFTAALAGNGTQDSDAQQAKLTLVAAGEPALVEPGQTITYQLAYSNTGSLTATGVVISTTLPANTSIDLVKNVGWSCEGGATVAGTPCSLSEADLAASASRTAVLKLEVLAETVTPATVALSVVIRHATSGATASIVLSPGGSSTSVDVGLVALDVSRVSASLQTPVLQTPVLGTPLAKPQLHLPSVFGK